MPSSADFRQGIETSAKGLSRLVSEAKAALAQGDLNGASTRLDVLEATLSSHHEVVRAYAELPREEKMEERKDEAKGGDDAKSEEQSDESSAAAPGSQLEPAAVGTVRRQR